MPRVTLQILVADQTQFAAALVHYETFAQKNASTDVAPHKATKIKLISHTPAPPNLLDVTLEYEHEVDLVLFGMSLGILKANDFLKPYLRPGVVFKSGPG